MNATTTGEGISISLSFAGIFGLQGCVETLACEVTMADVLRTLGVDRDGLNSWSKTLVYQLRNCDRPFLVTIPAAYLQIIGKLYKTCFELVSESAMHTVTGSERWELDAAEQELLEALRAAGVAES